MRTRGYVRIDDDAKLEQIDTLAANLQHLGFDVTDVANITGQITGTVDERDLPKIEKQVHDFGGRFVKETDDVVHRLPEPSAEVQ